jgi:D-aminoacyl-tRNA deacylase
MRAVIQRVSQASVTINGSIKGEIASGLLVLVGVCTEDDETDATYLAQKIIQLRIFSDEQGLMNKSLTDIGGDILLVSQFTLYASTKKGNRPSFIAAARPELAIPLYELVKQELTTALAKPISSGEFGADMQVALVNDGPVTIIIDSQHKQ